jgi:muramoyltetrapeptide carboxypeptidase LdcA involved in peptidoglycan recycling
MPCKTQIKIDLNKEIDKKLGGYRDTTHSDFMAKEFLTNINNKYPNLASISVFDKDRVVINISEKVFNSIVDEKYDAQLKIEEELAIMSGEVDFDEKDTSFYNGDEALFDQENKEDIFIPEVEDIAEVEEEYPIQTEYKKELEKTGKKPTSVIIGGSKAILNNITGTYDITDLSGKIILLKNINLDTMELVEEPVSLKPYDQKAFNSFVNDTMLNLFTEEQLAYKGIDITDIFDELEVITTESQLVKIMVKVLKNLC